jgi:methylated-DNA-[protein]-cysteine S-methyltransferase
MPAAAALGYCLFRTAIGSCALAWGEGALVCVQLPEHSGEATHARMQRRHPEVPEAAPPPFVQHAIDRIQALLAGERDDLRDIPLDMTDVPAFHRQVYEIARAIPPGQVKTYGAIAREMGDPGAARAVGQALGANPFAPVVPCHRVLAAGGRSGGFSAEGGTATKLKMLEIERAQLGEGPGLFD